LSDRQFCCDEHRRIARRAYSLRSARDHRNVAEYEESWLVTAADLQGKPQQKASFGLGSGLLLVGITLALVLALPRSDGTLPIDPISYLPPSAGMGDRLTRALPFKGSVRLRDDFRLDLRNWQSAAASVDGAANTIEDWVVRSGAIYPGRLALWKPTLTLHDYQLEFQARIESKAVGWAYRAADNDNYYASKLIVSHTRDSSRAEISRWAVVAGRVLNKTSLPIPINVRTGKPYDVQMLVKGDRFTTLVNGQLVDVWSDRRLKRGGVGFFSDANERAALEWVSIVEKDNFLGRFLNFGLIVPPAVLYQ
jgi:hypothetical protein